MKTKINIYNILLPLVALMLFWSCKDDEFSKDYDIEWPRPSITNINPSDKAMISSEMIISGTGFSKVLNVTIDGKILEITDTSDSELKVKLPRRFLTSSVVVTNLYRQSVASEAKIAPEYPSVVVSTYPVNIQQDQIFVIKGENVDLITSVKIGDSTVTVNGTDAASLNVPTKGLALKPGDKVKIEAVSSLTDVLNSQSAELEVIEQIRFPRSMKPLVLYDFENGTNTFVPADGGIPATSTLNGAGVTKARGEHYLTVKASNVATWKDLGYIEIPNSVAIDTFTHPHLTFLVNTNGKAGYFQLEDGQGNYYHFKQSPDDYKFATNGWEWRSYDITKPDDGKPMDLKNFKMRLMFKSGNVSGDFEIHLDQVMITNGKVKPIETIFSFDGSVPTWDNGSGAEHGLNLSGIEKPTGYTGNYFTVKKSGAGEWDWTGAISKNSLDLSKAKDPHINVWVNTNGKKGFFQIETFQDGIKWGVGISNDNSVETTGWKLFSWRLSEFAFSKWGGEGTATNVDVSKAVDYFKIGFSTGSAAPNYEINIDEVILSDGPLY